MIRLSSHKRGDTFKLDSMIKDANGDPLDLPAENIRSHIRDKRDKLVTELSVTKILEDEGRYLFEASAAQTREWPMGALWMDIEITHINGVIVSSPTIMLDIVKDITYDE